MAEETRRKVQRDEPLFEISTDKVDAEIPAPASGILREIKAQEGATVQVYSVVAVIGGAGAPATAAPKPAEPAREAARPAAQTTTAPAQRPPAQQQQHEVISFPATHREEGERIRSSPLVRRIARENNVDLASVPGTGLGGRITKDDILNFVQQHGPGAAQPARPAPAQPVTRPAPAQPVQQPQAST